MTSHYIRKKNKQTKHHDNNHTVKLKQCPPNTSGSSVLQWLLSLFGPLSFEGKASPTMMPLLQGLQLLWFVPPDCTGHSLGFSGGMLKQYWIPHRKPGTLAMEDEIPEDPVGLHRKKTRTGSCMGIRRGYKYW